MQITIVGCGYVGSALASHWRGLHRLKLTTTRPERIEELAALGGEVRVLEGRDETALHAALEGAEAAVLTLAPTGDRQVGVDAYARTYIDTCRSLAAVLPRLPGLRQVLYTGSCSVYGDAAGGWVDETTPTAPTDEHGQVLVEAERILLGCRRPGLAVGLFRLGALHGPGREIHRRFAPLAGRSRPGDGRHHTNWIHRDDAVAALDLALRQRLDAVVNLVDGHPITARALMEAVCRARGLPPVIWEGTAAAHPPVADRRVRNDRLRALGLRLRHPRVDVPSPCGAPLAA